MTRRDFFYQKPSLTKKSTKKKEKLDFLSMRFRFLLDTPLTGTSSVSENNV